MPTALVRVSSSPTPASFTLSLIMPITTTRQLLEPTNSIGQAATAREAPIGSLVILLRTDIRSCLWLIRATPQRPTTSSVWPSLEPTMPTLLLVTTSTTTTVLQYCRRPVVPPNFGSHLPSLRNTHLYFFCYHYYLYSLSLDTT